MKVVLAPGWGGSAESPLLVRLGRRLEAEGIEAKRITFGSRDADENVEQLRRERADVLIGRSYGGRICAYLAVEQPPRALVVLGYPIRPPGKRRERDEQALGKLSCPTLIVQGSRDELGPMRVLRACVSDAVELRTLKGAGHSFGSMTSEAIEAAVSFVARYCGATA